jgi:hypothetical protein
MQIKKKIKKKEVNELQRRSGGCEEGNNTSILQEIKPWPLEYS